MMQQNQSFKLLIVGDSQVGKTNFVKMLNDQSFSDAYRQHAPIEIFQASFDKDDGSTLQLEFFKFNGDCRFSKHFYKNYDGAFVIFDVGNQNSFQNVPYWIDGIKKFGESDGPIIVLGNKIDQFSNDRNLRKVKREEAQALANQYHAKYLEISVKNNYNLEKSVIELVKGISLINKEILIVKQLDTKHLQKIESQ